MNILFFDTETTGLWEFNKPDTDPAQPYLVQLAVQLRNESERNVCSFSLIANPTKWTTGKVVIPANAAAVHGITQDVAEAFGHIPTNVLRAFDNALRAADLIVAHNIDYDMRVIEAAYHRSGWDKPVWPATFCTMKQSADIVQIGQGAYGSWKWPKLNEAYAFFTGKQLGDKAHDAMWDVYGCAKVYRGIQRWAEANDDEKATMRSAFKWWREQGRAA